MRLKVAVLADMREERWPSMDLAADMLVAELETHHADEVDVRLVRPRLVPLTRPLSAGPASIHDRIANRYWLYRRALGTVRDWADVFHIVDHSYAHLVRSLPADRTIVTCHDVDAFVRPRSSGADVSRLPGFLTRRTVAGLRRAARVVCPSEATFRALAELELVDAASVAVVHNGVDRPDVSSIELEALAAARLGPAGVYTDVLHVGSSIPRKRIDVLLDAFAGAARHGSNLRLVHAGGALNPVQQQRMRTLGIADRVMDLPPLARRELLAVYRRAAILVATSEREGFCLPVAEALSAGVPVVATDLPVFREVAGNAATYVRLDDAAGWVDAITRLLAEREQNGELWQRRRDDAVRQAALYDWKAYAARMVAHYRDVASGVAMRAPGYAAAGASA